MPGHVKGQSIPGFLGGSDLAVPVTSSNKSLASDWIKDFTCTTCEKALQAKGNIPNATNLLGGSVNERAAARSWFVPTAKHWVDVENGNILTQHAGADPHRQALGEAGSCVGQRQHRIGAQPVVTGARSKPYGCRRRDHALPVPAASPFLAPNAAGGDPVRAGRCR